MVKKRKIELLKLRRIEWDALKASKKLSKKYFLNNRSSGSGKKKKINKTNNSYVLTYSVGLPQSWNQQDTNILKLNQQIEKIEAINYGAINRIKYC